MNRIPDEIFLEPPAGSETKHAILFISGNPGLIAYYKTFLNRIHEQVNAQNPAVGVAVYGKSLGGFEVNKQSKDIRLHSLADQVKHIHNVVNDLGRILAQNASSPVPLTLVGHSAGTYILLRCLQEYDQSMTNTSATMKVVAGILLFPTVVDVAKSPAGIKSKWPLSLPLAAPVGGNVAWAAAQVVPRSVLRSVMAQTPPFRDAQAGPEKEDALETNVAFFKSPLGVEELIHLAADEMKTITEDRFGEEIWGFDGSNSSENTNQKERPKMFFYFGSEDHWVSNTTREALIASRAYQSKVSEEPVAARKDWHHDSRPWMEIDQHGTNHAFGIYDSGVVVDKVCEYMGVVLSSGGGSMLL
ncbi:MAG: hypothetical protein Q9162_007150 [Coniocarpon cinnabarinum]